MNGKAPMQAPPSVQQSRQRQGPQGQHAYTGLWKSRILWAVVVFAALAMIAAQVIAAWQAKTPKAAADESTMAPTWARQAFQYKAEEPVIPPPPKPPEDTISPALAALRRELAMQRAELDMLKNRPASSATVVQQPVKETKPPAALRATPAPTQMITRTLSADKEESAPGAKKYVLSPGTFLPCAIETKMNSEVEGYFTAKVNQNVYDTATRRHLLVPQGSTILGHDNSSQLVYGNERMDTVSLTLSLPDARSVDLGRAPVTDQEGVAGLTGEVDQHYWRLLSAVLIGGVLKGGMQALQTSMTQAAGAGQVASGIGTLGNQATSQVVGRALDTRPTIKVFAGQQCNVLLIKELKLPAMWQ